MDTFEAIFVSGSFLGGFIPPPEFGFSHGLGDVHKTILVVKVYFDLRSCETIEIDYGTRYVFHV